MAAFAIAVAVMGLTVAVTVPVSNADVLPNGYDVSCKKANDSQVVCTVGGCPRVYEEYAGDVVHTRVNALPQHEIGKSCDATITQTVDMSTGFNYAVQGCRKHKASGDDCGAWSDYTYTPPAAAPAPAPAPAAPPPPAAPQTKQCPDGGPVVPIADACPVKKTAPTNAVTMKVQRAGLQVNVTVGNTSDLAAQCTYDATEANGLGLPVHRDFNLAARGSTTLTFPAPLIGQSWQLVSACSAPFEGQTVEIGRATGSA
ncbi:MAG TPA: hypothetical protein PKI77_16735 [Mycobacterium sp.]|nr:hypothetical protein [Mycobacterium sp.]